MSNAASCTVLLFSTLLLSTDDADAADAKKPAKPAALAPADNWVNIESHGADCKHFWDPSTLSMKDGKRKAWFMISCASRGGFPGGPSDIMSSVLLFHFDCTDKSSAMAQATTYRQQFGHGAVVSSGQQMVTERRLEEAVPNTIGMTYVTTACSAQLPAE